MQSETVLVSFNLGTVVLGLFVVIRAFRKNGFLAALGCLFMVFGVYVVLWSLVLDWFYNYSRRGMEAFVYLLMWGTGAVSFLLGLGIHALSKRQRKP